MATHQEIIEAFCQLRSPVNPPKVLTQDPLDPHPWFPSVPVVATDWVAVIYEPFTGGPTVGSFTSVGSTEQEALDNLLRFVRSKDHV